MDQKITYDFDTPISRKGTHAEKYEARQRRFGHSTVEPFWVADMDLPTPAFITDALRARINHPMFGYTDAYPELFDSIIWWMQTQHRATVERAAISLSPSVVTTISMVIQTCTKPGDGIALLSPVYGPFFGYTEQHHRQVVDCPLQIENGLFKINFAELDNQLSKPSVKLVLFCNPHNPGGRVWTQDELQQISDLCVKYDVILFSDEIHCDIVYPPAKHCSLLNIACVHDHLIVAHSIGKTFNCSGLQASFSIIPDAHLRTKFCQTQELAHVGDINLLGKIALVHALSPAGAEYKKQLILFLHENIRQVCARLNQIVGITVMNPEATFLVWADFRAFGSWQDVFKKLINEADVALSGGTFFGPTGEGWFRINCAHPRTKLLRAVDRIVKVFSAP